MDIFLLLTVLITSAIQSLFGVGILLFGTPILLLLNYEFFDALLILLPISASVNLMQVIKGYKEIDFDIYKHVLLITVPFIIMALYFLSKFTINLTIFIGLFLMIIALKEYVTLIKNVMSKLLSYNKIFYVVMGIIHGMTNLGGALLTAKIFNTNLNKYQKRSTIALSYMTFALFQIVTILLLTHEYNISNLLFVLIGLGVYILVNKFFFYKITNTKYDKLFAAFLFVSGVTLILK